MDALLVNFETFFESAMAATFENPIAALAIVLVLFFALYGLRSMTASGARARMKRLERRLARKQKKRLRTKKAR